MPIRLAPNTTLKPRTKRRPGSRKRGIIWFYCGDSIGQGFESEVTTTVNPEWTSSVAPTDDGLWIWNQHTVDYPGNRFATSATAGSTFVPFGPGHGLDSGAGEGTIDPMWYFGKAMRRALGPEIDHYFVKWAVSGAVINPTPTNSLTSLEPAESGNASFVVAHSTPALAAFRMIHGVEAHCGGLIVVSLAGDASSVGEPSYVAGADTAYDTNATTFIDDFRTTFSFTDAECPCWWGRAPTVGAGVTTLDRLSTVRTETDSLDGSNGVTVVDIDTRERAADDIHNTARGCGDVGGTLAAAVLGSGVQLQAI